MKMTYAEKVKALKTNVLSTVEYNQVKTLKAFKVSDWRFDANEILYKRVNHRGTK